MFFNTYINFPPSFIPFTYTKYALSFVLFTFTHFISSCHLPSFIPFTYTTYSYLLFFVLFTFTHLISSCHLPSFIPFTTSDPQTSFPLYFSPSHTYSLLAIFLQAFLFTSSKYIVFFVLSTSRTYSLHSIYKFLYFLCTGDPYYVLYKALLIS